MLHCFDSVEEDNTGTECIRFVLTDNIKVRNFLEVGSEKL